MRKSIGSTALAGLAVLALSLSAQAQDKAVTTSKDAPETLKVTVSGSVALDWVWHDEMTNLVRATQTGGGTDVTEESGDFEGIVRISLDIDLTENVSANITLGNNDRSQGAVIAEPATGLPVPLAGGPAVLGNNTETTAVIITDVSVTFAELLDPAVTIRLGTQNHAFDIRGNGSAFFFDPRKSESFANNTFQGSATGATPSGAAFDLPGQDYLQPAGLTLTYVRDKLELNVIAWTAIEGGRSVADESNLGVDFYYDVNDNTRVGGILMLTSFGAHDPYVGGPDSAAATSDAGGDTAVITIGGGIVLSDLSPGLTLYGEIYLQAGDAGKGTYTGFAGPGSDTFEAAGMALLVGADYTLSEQTSVGGSITMITGDDDSDDEIGNFLTYENVNDLLILEDQAFGIDIDTNITLIKGYIKHMLQPNLELTGMIGLATATEGIVVGLPTPSDEDALGVEIDARLTYAYSAAVNFTARLGILTGSDVLEGGGELAGMNDPDDSAMIFTLGTDFKF